MSRPFVLPNRKAFADFITRVFLKYRSKEKESGNARELFPHQMLIRDYLMIETPYRGILVYHGLGSGKTCTSIAAAESLLTTNKVFVMLPASLEQNFRGEIRKCGDPVYTYDQYWVERELTEESAKEAKALGISDDFLARNRKFFVSIQGREPNFLSLDKATRDLIGKQVEDVINTRFTFIRYNGLSSANIERVAPKEGPNPYDDSVVIIDEVHNLISRIVNQSDIARKLYDKIYTAKNCKIVALSGTPVINRPNEISYLMNLLRGPIERIVVPFTTAPTWDEERMTNVLRGIPEIDTVEYNAVKKYILITRNPPHFRSVYNDKGDRIAVQYVKDLTFTESAVDWVRDWKSKFETDIGGGELAIDKVTVEVLEALPTDYKEFTDMFLDGLNIKNPLLFQKRIQGLVSYFKGADERVLPRRIDDDKMLEKSDMSSEQFTRYLEVRWREMQLDRRRNLSMNDDLSSFRVNSRLVCNYAIPPEFRSADTDAATEDGGTDKSAILDKLKQNPQKYLSKKALEIFSPKMLKMLKNVEDSMGPKNNWNNQFIYSQYLSLEGLGVFAAILDANGWQEYRIVKEANQWVEDKTLDPEKPSYAFYSGENPEQRELMRQIFNGVGFSDDFPASLKASVEAAGKKLCLFMGSKAAAEGITLNNVRHVHIMEPYWNPARHDQVIGRAIRINSHATLPPEERTVRVSFYLSVFSQEQTKTVDGNNIVPIRRNDTEMKRYEGEPVEAFMTTDEVLYETAYEKDRVNQRISVLLKQSSVDCEIHRKLHSRETPVLSCMRFDSNTSPEDLAFKPSIKTDDVDTSYLRNLTKRKRRLQQVQIKDIVFYIDPVTKQVFDGPAFDDNERLLQVGILTSSTSIRWLTQ
jgi:hypothetical protein